MRWARGGSRPGHGGVAFPPLSSFLPSLGEEEGSNGQGDTDGGGTVWRWRGDALGFILLALTSTFWSFVVRVVETSDDNERHHSAGSQEEEGGNAHLSNS